jgi:hypothetical protein
MNSSCLSKIILRIPVKVIKKLKFLKFVEILGQIIDYQLLDNLN